MKAFCKSLVLFLVFFNCFFLETKAYSIISHQAVVDAAWKTSILPLLQKRFPAATDSVLKDAHAFAYGGSVAADMGYFPFGSALYSNLVHYVRSGDFVKALIDEAADVNEYAFAMGFLSHYNADKFGHSMATNIAAPKLYPKVKKKFGAVATYEEDPVAHGRTEFGFDVLQVARGNYESQAYREFIGFQISKTALEKAFFKTYGLHIDDVFGSYSMAVGTFRWTVKSLVPTLTKAAWKSKKNEIRKLKPGVTSRAFNYRMNRKTYYQSFGKEREKAGLGASLVAFAVRILPKIGPLKKLRFVIPDGEVERLFIKSFDTAMLHMAKDVRDADHNLQLANIDYDTGKPTRRGEYHLADATYDKLLLKLHQNNFQSVTEGLKNSLLWFYSVPLSTENQKEDVETIKRDSILLALKQFRPQS